jgi:hypothetical protein
LTVVEAVEPSENPTGTLTRRPAACSLAYAAMTLPPTTSSKTPIERLTLSL